jgi:hypothetical protein
MRANILEPRNKRSNESGVFNLNTNTRRFWSIECRATVRPSPFIVYESKLPRQGEALPEWQQSASNGKESIDLSYKEDAIPSSPS